MDLVIALYGLLGFLLSLSVTFVAWYGLWKGIISKNEIVQSILSTKIEQKGE